MGGDAVGHLGRGLDTSAIEQGGCLHQYPPPRGLIGQAGVYSMDRMAVSRHPKLPQDSFGPPHGGTSAKCILWTSGGEYLELELHMRYQLESNSTSIGPDSSDAYR